jgi:hypothetical protein
VWTKGEVKAREKGEEEGGGEYIGVAGEELISITVRGACFMFHDCFPGEKSENFLLGGMKAGETPETAVARHVDATDLMPNKRAKRRRITRGCAQKS